MRSRPTEPKLEPASRPTGEHVFPVVGIGASAGGLEALEKFVGGIKPRSGIAYIAVTHQHPGHVSLLPELLAKRTKISVQAAVNGARVRPDTFYLSTSNGYLTISGGVLRITEPGNGSVLRLPIDNFFRSLAQDQTSRAVGIVLSGTATDGTLGLKAIKAEGGMVMAQDPDSAKFSGMPTSAIATGQIDYVLPPEQMPAQLASYVGSLSWQPEEETSEIRDEELSEPMRKIITLIKARTGHDFSFYKGNTMRRRIERRINVHQLKGPVEYLQFIRDNPNELDLVFRELLIGVTQFFRDPEAFESLAREFIHKLLLSRSEDTPVRIWVPACSSGEEAYSLAMLMREEMERQHKRFTVQIFGTDLDPLAVDVARVGLYPEGIERDMTPARLTRFFVKDDGGYRVKKDLREMAIFATQNVLKDPPFTKLDLISCRNLLIYFKPEAQKRLLELFNYALRPNGILFLGTSESINNLGDQFAMGNKKWKIFTGHKVAGHPALKDGETAQSKPEAEPAKGETQHAGREFKPSFSTLIERMLLNTFVPTSVIVHSSGDIAYIHGRTGDFLEPSTGQPRLNILEMAREGLRLELGSALRRASKQSDAVVHDGIPMKSARKGATLQLSVSKLRDPESIRGLLLVTFQISPASKAAAARKATMSTGKVRADAISALEQELQYTKETLQSTVEELETANEELKSTNEEMQSTNEELQSVNEELETSKEEMQSLNEELQTVNAQLQAKVEDLGQANDDMQNLLNSTDIATIFLDRNLRIKRFTKEATKLINLIPTDVGRPISHLASNLDYDQLESDATEVLRTLVFREREIQTKSGYWRQVHISPYRTTDNIIDGLVMTFLDIHRVKQAEKTAKARSDYAESIVATVREPLVVLDESLKIISCNEAFYTTFNLQPKRAVGRPIYEMQHWDIPALRKLLERILPAKSFFNDFKMKHDSPQLGRRTFLLNARQLAREPGLSAMILLAMEDMSKHAAAGITKPARKVASGPKRKK